MAEPAAAESVRYGLQAALFTSSLYRTDYAVRRLGAGAVMVNDSTVSRLDATPFGGAGGPGRGREGVSTAVLEVSEPKLVCYNYGRAENVI